MSHQGNPSVPENQTTQTEQKNKGKLFFYLSGVVVLLSFAVAFWVYPQLPEQIPSHWDIAGQVNGYSNPLSGAFLMPLINLGTFLLLLILPHVDPKKNNYRAMSKVYSLTCFLIIVFLSVIYAGTLLSALGNAAYQNLVPLFIFCGVGLLFIVLGNYMGKVKYNFTFGIRTPWTLANEEVWYKTHRAMGPVWVVGGVVIFIAGFFPQREVVFGVMLAVTAVISLGSLLYSFLTFRRLAK